MIYYKVCTLVTNLLFVSIIKYDFNVVMGGGGGGGVGGGGGGGGRGGGGGGRLN